MENNMEAIKQIKKKENKSDDVTLTERFAEEELVENKKEIENKGKNKIDKKFVLFLVIGIISLIGGIVCLLFGFFVINNIASDLSFPQVGAIREDNVVYSDLTGERLADVSLKTAPTYCIQTPNGTDGARPQAGLTQAGVVFEAIAEAGITRFAAIYQNPTSAVIGPIRSLRIYYLQWDTPFDCTIVHAGGADDALKAVASGGYKDLSEDYSYMYRGTYGSRLWNNLFTTASYLKQFSEDRGYNTSNINGFNRMTPEESEKARIDDLVTEKLNIVKPANGSTSEFATAVDNIDLSFASSANFNVHYSYNAETNTYFRSYESGVAHEVYECDAVNLGEKNPEDVCSLTQVNPAVVVAMVVKEGRAADGYHEDITTIGTGDAYIFQNGGVIKGTWTKGAVDQQIKFFGEDGSEVALAPGQTFISAVPDYGSVEY